MTHRLQRFRPTAVAALILILAVATSAPARAAEEPAAKPAATGAAAAKPAGAEARKAARAQAKAAKKEARAKRLADRAAKTAKQEAEDTQNRTPWQRDANWLSLRFGYAKSAADHHAHGDVGGGFGYNHFLNRRWAVGAHVNVDMLGRFGGSSELSVPVTLELTRHIKWNTQLRPYVGLGAGAFYYSAYRTGQDYSEVRPGMYLTGGFNTPISDRSLIGIDTRVQWSNDAGSKNAVFPDAGPSVMHWSIKLNYQRWQ